jgi:hypothetical protein
MPVSQNLRFSVPAAHDAEFEHPPGAALMRSLSTALSTSGWRAGELTNWRDSGWSIECVRNSSELQIALAQIQDGEWMLQVTRLRTAGLIAGLFGAKSSASAEDVFELALAVHRALIGAQLLGDAKWRWDGFPDEKNSTSEPIAA